jgi:hypothetical protein
MLRAGAIAGATSLAFFGVGDMTNAVAGYSGPGHIAPQFGTSEYAFNVAGHALVGCGSSVASGGSCGSGALAAGLGAGAGPMMGGMNFTQRLVANTVLGGVGSVAGGGKFANGAVTGAFGYLFNAMAGCYREVNNCRSQMFEGGGGGGIGGGGTMDLGAALGAIGGGFAKVTGDWLSGIYNSVAKLGTDQGAVGPHTT